ncbi:hypothetical protein SLEP1_g49260 [Rubroshorea leprosula]|uniref:Uncharacterized protein n=1 Tax=Rubroshorea leprosula TaxID=152421 RepID=A0AAV5LWB1_9ROSI|nr:hypothetical protein SLEP1_g49260 [Rubroshorea leprosula]
MNVNFMGSGHVLVEKNVSFSYENIEERKGRAPTVINLGGNKRRRRRSDSQGGSGSLSIF